MSNGQTNKQLEAARLLGVAGTFSLRKIGSIYAQPAFVLLARFAATLHRCSKQQLPVTVVGAGLPQLRGRMGEAKSYAERLFDFPEICPLSPSDSREAIVRPARHEEAEIFDEATDLIVDKTKGYPYFLQEWGKHTWDVAPKSPIRQQDVINASTEAVAALDESFFRVRFDRLTPSRRNISAPWPT